MGRTLDWHQLHWQLACCSRWFQVKLVGASVVAFLLEIPHSHALLPAAWLRNRHRIEKEGIRVSPTISLRCTASQNALPRLSMHRFAIAGAAFC